MPDDLENLYATIASNILSETGQCVLILGPELSVGKDGTGYKKYFREIVKENTSESSYLSSDNLFYFKDDFDKNVIISKVKDFYNNAGDSVLLEMISRIEFPLIINVCPDVALNKIYKSKGILFKDGYFAKESKALFNSLPLPTKELPVIYNIFGTISIDQSLIFTHNKLYQLIEYLLPQKSLPDNIESYINNIANSFLFLGFKFDSWYYQLICHKLGLNPKTNICTPFNMDNENVSIVMKKSFNMDFTPENPSQCIGNILKRCGDQVRKASPTGIYSTFVSYAWSDSSNTERENIVNLSEQKFKEQKENLFTLFRDRKDLTYGDSIDSFMHTIGSGKTVILVVSDKYLRSKYCMIEALRVSNYADKEKRIFIILMADAAKTIKDDEAKDELDKTYKKHWWDECQRLLKDPNKLGREEFDNCVKIFGFVDKFITNMKDKLNLSLDYPDVFKSPASNKYEINNRKKAEFDAFIKSVLSKMKED
jgi:hypothetical protein